MSEITYSIHEVATGIFQLKMPLPFRLNHINLYLLEDTCGWVLIDTGLNTEKTLDLWEIFLSSGFFEKPITKIILTHLHPDHIGMSAWLSERLDVPVFLSQGDWDMAQFLWENDSDIAKILYTDYWKSFGVESHLLDDMLESRLHYKKLVKRLPEHIHFLEVNSLLLIKDQQWNLLAMPGHSPEHMCLWNPAQKILISGDHVLPTITPNISFHPTGLTNPLESYLLSLETLLELDCDYYLPAHGPISSNLHERVKGIIQHHQEKFVLIMNHTESPITVAEAVPILFSKELPPHQLMFAYAETAAHLIYLSSRNFLHLDRSQRLLFSRQPSQKVYTQNKIFLPLAN
jgi:glyoxylase-like metal-dependent hydrolase (beta-lactamase superfamily II)